MTIPRTTTLSPELQRMIDVADELERKWAEVHALAIRVQAETPWTPVLLPIDGRHLEQPLCTDVKMFLAEKDDSEWPEALRAADAESTLAVCFSAKEESGLGDAVHRAFG